jgi:hypothetical protein
VSYKLWQTGHNIVTPTTPKKADPGIESNLNQATVYTYLLQTKYVSLHTRTNKGWLVGAIQKALLGINVEV